MRSLWLFACAVFAAALSYPAFAAEDVRYEPAPAWVQPITPEPAKRSDHDGSLRALLEDIQVRFSADGVENYYQTAWQVLSAEGLDDAGEVSRSWDPLTETMTIHAVEIVRDGKVINALSEGQPFSIIRQEPNLSYAVIDGRLTATLQLEDLRVGDIVRFASTRTEKDPTLGQHIDYWNTLYHDGAIGRVRYRQIWPKDREVRWRATEGFAKPVVSQTSLGTELISDARDVRMPLAPKGAPGRFNTLGELEISSFKSWRELSALFAPYYEQARKLKEQSPIRAEAEKIRAAHATKAAQASAALALVEQRVRYVALTMGASGYQPAAADLTWSRRFGDCKGKSALLMALLAELGIESEAVIVQTSGADGMETRLPRASLFDHVIVRAQIDGRSYWMDATRSLDTDINRLVTPPYQWALPLRAGGADLEPLKQEAPKEPLSEIIMSVDARGGVTETAPVAFVHIQRGEAALAGLRKLASVSRADAERNVRENWARDMPGITAETIKLGFVLEADGSLRSEVIGKIKTPWRAATGSRAQELGFSDTAFATSFEKRPSDAMHREAPVSLSFPYFTRARVIVTLPREGQGFELIGADVDATVAGTRVQRTATIKEGTATIVLDVRTVASETSYAEAMAAESRFNALQTAKMVTLRAPRDFSLTQAEAGSAVAERPKDGEAYATRGEALMNAMQPTAALADFNQALALEPTNTNAAIGKAAVLWDLGRVDEALKTLDPLIEDPERTANGYIMRGVLYETHERYAEALADYDKAVELAPNFPRVLASRADVHKNMGNQALALKDIEAALRLEPDDDSLQRSHIWIEHGDDNRQQPWRDAMIAYLGKRIVEEPKLAELYAERAVFHSDSGDWKSAKADYDKALSLEPTAQVYMARAASLAMRQENSAAEADFAKAVELQPTADSYRGRAAYYLQRRNFAAARKDLAEAAKLDPDAPATEILLAHLEVADGAASDAFARMEKLVRRDPASRDLLLEQAEVHYSGKAYDLAVSEMQALLRRPGHSPSEVRSYKDSIAGILGEKGDLAGSLKLYDELISEKPKDPQFLNGRCWARATAGQQLALAKADCEAAMALSSPQDHSAYLDSLGLVYLRMDQPAQAVVTFDKALKLTPGLSPSLYGRGLARARLGETAAAEVDIAAAKDIDAEVVATYARYGVER